MKFVHIADVHLGAEPGRLEENSAQQRSREIWNSFRRVVEMCEKEQIDLLLIAGGFVSPTAAFFGS
ncbi:MAG: metallophosphoesterase [Lachnoclostridium sp.]